MAERFLDFFQRPATLDEPGCERVTEVVEAEAVDSGDRQGRFPGAAEGVPVPTAEDAPLCSRRPSTREDGIGVGAERYLAAVAALGQLEPDHAARTVDAIPCEA